MFGFVLLRQVYPVSRLPTKQSLNVIQPNVNDVTLKRATAVTANYVNFKSKPTPPQLQTAKLVNTMPSRRISIFRPVNWDGSDPNVISSLADGQHIEMDVQKTMAIPIKTSSIRHIDEAHIATAQLQSLQNQPRIGTKYRSQQSHTSAIVQKVIPKNILVSTARLPNKIDLPAPTPMVTTATMLGKGKPTTTIMQPPVNNMAVHMAKSASKAEPISKMTHIMADNTKSTKKNIQLTNRTTMSESSRPVDTGTHKLLTPGGVNTFAAIPADMNGLQRKQQTKSTKLPKQKVATLTSQIADTINHPNRYVDNLHIL